MNMAAYRVSVTTLEKFRRYMNDLTSYDTEAALIEVIAGTFKGNDKTKFGGAYHKLIEHGSKYYIPFDNAHLVDDFFFTRQQAEPAIEFHYSHRLMVHEMTVSKVYDTAYFPIQVSGRIDGIEGREVRDAKTLFRSVDETGYMDSLQWQYYLDILDLDVFWYDLFEVKRFKELPKEVPYVLPNVQIIYHDPLKCERYDTMNRVLIENLNSFISFMHNRNLIHLFKPAIEEECQIQFSI